VLLCGDALQGDSELREFLEALGMEVRLSSAADVEQLSRAGSHFVLLLGVHEATASSAPAYIRQLRCSGVAAPILLVSMGFVRRAVVEALEAGATDFVQRSSGKAELSVRLQLLAARAVDPSIDQRIRVADLEIHRESRVARRGGTSVQLTDREFRMLERLVENAGEAVRREDLEFHVWGREGANGRGSNLLEVYILYLRRKLSVLGYASAIRTLRGVGYTIVLGTELTYKSQRGVEPRSGTGPAERSRA